MFTVYILQSLKDNKTYVGYTNNFERRFDQHNSGKSKSTKYRAPFKLLINEEFENSVEAKKRELWWKGGSGRRKLKEYFNKC
jgi:putative endonuclease